MKFRRRKESNKGEVIPMSPDVEAWQETAELEKLEHKVMRRRKIRRGLGGAAMIGTAFSAPGALLWLTMAAEGREAAIVQYEKSLDSINTMVASDKLDILSLSADLVSFADRNSAVCTVFDEDRKQALREYAENAEPMLFEPGKLILPQETEDLFSYVYSRSELYSQLNSAGATAPELCAQVAGSEEVISEYNGLVTDLKEAAISYETTVYTANNAIEGTFPDYSFFEPAPEMRDWMLPSISLGFFATTAYLVGRNRRWS